MKSPRMNIMRNTQGDGLVALYQLNLPVLFSQAAMGPARALFGYVPAFCNLCAKIRKQGGKNWRHLGGVVLKFLIF